MERALCVILEIRSILRIVMVVVTTATTMIVSMMVVSTTLTTHAAMTVILSTTTHLSSLMLLKTLIVSLRLWSEALIHLTRNIIGIRIKHRCLVRELILLWMELATIHLWCLAHHRHWSLWWSTLIILSLINRKWRRLMWQWHHILSIWLIWKRIVSWHGRSCLLWHWLELMLWIILKWLCLLLMTAIHIRLKWLGRLKLLWHLRCSADRRWLTLPYIECTCRRIKATSTNVEIARAS